MTLPGHQHAFSWRRITIQIENNLSSYQKSKTAPFLSSLDCEAKRLSSHSSLSEDDDDPYDKMKFPYFFNAFLSSYLLTSLSLSLLLILFVSPVLFLLPSSVFFFHLSSCFISFLLREFICSLFSIHILIWISPNVLYLMKNIMKNKET